MRLRRWSRVMPAFTVLALLCMAAAAAPRTATPGGAPPPQLYPPCDAFLDAGSGDSSYAYANGDGVMRPLAPGISAAAYSVRTDGLGESYACMNPLRFYVARLDARGRRVGESAGGAAGTWQWNSADRGGQTLPAGMYFMHARDSQGVHADDRVVIVR